MMDVNLGLNYDYRFCNGTLMLEMNLLLNFVRD